MEGNDHPASGRLAGKVVLVTGGTKGIGRGIVERLAREGATVMFTGRDRAAGEETARFLAEGVAQPPTFLEADVTDHEHTRRVVAAVLEAHDRIDGLVNNAAVLDRRTILDSDPQFVLRVLSVNLLGAIECTRLALGPMLERGRGSIVNIGSTHAWSGMEALFAYSIAKGGLLTLTHHVARNYANRGIRCNWVTVGWVLTPGELEFWTRDGKGVTDIDERARTFMPMGRMQTPGEIAASVAFLLSDDAGQVTDTELWVTGGLRV